MSHRIIEQIFNNYDWPDFEKEKWQGWFGFLENPDSVDARDFLTSGGQGWNCACLNKKECKIQYRDENFMIIMSSLDMQEALLWKGA